MIAALSFTAFGQETTEAKPAATEEKPAATEETYKTETVKKFVFSYLVVGDNLKVKVSCPTAGWVAVGFNPTKKMKDANFIIGYNAKGKAVVDDQFGDSPYGHKSDTELEGKNDIIESTCTEAAGITTLTFTIPLTHLMSGGTFRGIDNRFSLNDGILTAGVGIVQYSGILVVLEDKKIG